LIEIVIILPIIIFFLSIIHKCALIHYAVQTVRTGTICHRVQYMVFVLYPRLIFVVC
jgi:hypothetical protein